MRDDKPDTKIWLCQVIVTNSDVKLNEDSEENSVMSFKSQPLKVPAADNRNE